MVKKIMIVDDEPDILSTVGQTLELSGYEVIKAVSSKDCLNKLKEVTPRSVFTGYHDAKDERMGAFLQN
jgi:DNA-binding NtrC family response regulator